MHTEPMDERALIEAATKLLERVLGFVPRVDARAQVLLGVDLGALLLLALNVPSPTSWTLLMVSAVIAGMLLILSVLALYRCAFPDLEGGANSLLYFREIAKLGMNSFVERFTTLTPSRHLQDLLGQVWHTSNIVHMKYASLKRAMLLLGVAIPFWLLALTVFVIHNQRLSLT